MALFVNTNVSALNGQKNLMDVTARMNSSFEKLSSGSRINSARDDAAGLQISDRLTTQITGLNQASRNANDGISIAQIAEGALGEVTNNIQRMRQLVVQGGNRTLAEDDRAALAEEFKKLANVNNDIADRTAYGTLKILNNESPESGFQIQSGAFAGEQDTVTTGNAKLTAMFGKVGADLDTASAAMSNVSQVASGQELIDDYGVVGELILAHIAAEGTAKSTTAGAVEAAADALFGTNRAGTVAELGTDAGTGEIKIDELTKILQNEATSGQGHLGTGSNVFDALVADDLFNLDGLDLTSYTSDDNGGLDDAAVNKLHSFATDTLLGAMSDLITQVDKQRAKLGAEQNGLTSTVRNNTTAVVNVSDSRARIQDTDFASETAELTRNQIIQQASTTILSQANQLPQTALSLLR